MNKSMENTIKEDILSAYIDSLNDDTKPINLSDDDIDDDILELFETVKAIKRLKGTNAEALILNKGKLGNKRRFNNLIKIAATVAAVFVIFISSLAIKNLVLGNSNKKTSMPNVGAAYDTAQKPEQSTSGTHADNKNTANEKMVTDASPSLAAGLQDSTKAAQPSISAAERSAAPTEKSDEAKPLLKSKNSMGITAGRGTSVAYDMQSAYNSISSYSGILEIQIYKDGNMTADQNVKITYKKPDKYIIADLNSINSTIEYSDGEKLYTVEGSRVNIDYVDTSKDLWRYHIGQQIQELQQASEIREAGSEVICGKDTMIYEYKFSGDQKYNRIWVDKKTKLPVKREINTASGRIVSVYKELNLNTVVDESGFNYNIKGDENVYYLNEKTSRSEIEEYIPQIKNIINSVPEYLTLQKTIKLKNDLYGYYIKYQDDTKYNFLDIYVSDKAVTKNYVPGDAHGSLQGGWTESESGAVNVFNAYIGKSNIVKWIGADYEIALISNVDTMELLKILEDAANTKITSISEEELNKMGVEPKS